MSFYLTVATTGWYRERCALELVRSLFPFVALERFANRFDLREQNLLRCSMRRQIVHRIDKVLSVSNQPPSTTPRRERGKRTKAMSPAFPISCGVSIFSN